MNTVKYTLGPWRYINESDMTPEEPFWIGAEHPTCGFVSHAVVRSGCSESDELGDLEANARLIAAAPELLDALTAFMSNAGLSDIDRDDSRFDRARAAIAKAVGNAS